jgi:hypothetical protein
VRLVSSAPIGRQPGVVQAVTRAGSNDGAVPAGYPRRAPARSVAAVRRHEVWAASRSIGTIGGMPLTSGRDGPKSTVFRPLLAVDPPRRMDLLKELRLRRWARENYVPESDRAASWDPIVLDEMRRRDEELAAPPCGEFDAPAGAMGSILIPLEPMTYALDPPHLGPGPPHFLSMPARASISEVPDWGFYFG